MSPYGRAGWTERSTQETLAALQRTADSIEQRLADVEAALAAMLDERRAPIRPLVRPRRSEP